MGDLHAGTRAYDGAAIETMTTFKEPANILLVDDDSRNLDVLESILSLPEYRLFRARTADEALLALIAEEFAVIVLDVRMPEVSGYEPRMALVAGATGTELHERLLNEAASFLAPGGLLAMELGQGQSADLRAKIETMPVYTSADILPDEAGIDRIVIVERVR